MSIRIIIQNNPFSSKYEEKKMDAGLTIRAIAESLNLDPKKQTILVMIDDETKCSLDYIVKENETLYMKIVPTGDENTWQNIDFLGLTGLNVVGGSGSVDYTWLVNGISNIVNGISNMVAGLVSNTGSSVAPPSSLGVSYLRGGSNTFGNGQPIPLILGKHRYYPMQVACPSAKYVPTRTYTLRATSSTAWFADEKLTLSPGVHINKPYLTSIGKVRSFKQQINQLYLLGHKEVKPIESTYKRGDTKIAALPGTVVSLDSTALYGSTAKKFINVSKTLNAWNATGYSGVEVVLQQGTQTVDFSIILPTFWFGNSDNTEQYIPTTFVRAVLKNITTDTVEFERVFILDGTSELKATVVPPTAITLPVNHTLDTTAIYTLAVTRGADDPTQDGTDDSTFATGHIFKGDENAKFSTSMTFASVNCYIDAPVISSSALSKYSILDVQLTDETSVDGNSTKLTGDIDNINVEVQTHIPIYSGTGNTSASWTTIEASSNPAALFLYVLQGAPNARPVPDELIDWEALGAWYNFCADSEHALECNLVLDKPGAVEDVLNAICLCGKASFLMGDTYSVIVDTDRGYPVQLITDKNSYGLTMTKSVANTLHGYAMTFIDAANDYQSNAEEIRIYRTGYNLDGTGVYGPDNTPYKEATLIEKLSIPGVTNETQLKKLARYLLNCLERRNSTISFNMDWEHLFANVDDRITVAYDLLLLGLANGRIQDVTRNGLTQITHLELDEEVTMEVGETYGITIRYATGLQVSLPIVNTETSTTIVQLISPIVFDIQVDDLYAFGTMFKQYGEFVIVSKSLGTELNAQVTAIPYAPEVFTYDDLPAFVSKITKPNDLGENNLITQVFDPEATAIKSSSGISNLGDIMNPSTKYAIKSSTPNASYLRDDVLEFKLTGFNLWFVSKTDLKLYSTGIITVDATPALRINKVIKDFAISEDESIVIYSDFETNNSLWKFDVVAGVHTQLTTNMAMCPVIQDDDVLYINYDDNGYVYSTSITDGGNGESVLNYTTTNISAINNKLVWIDVSLGNVVIKDLSLGDADLKGTVYTTVTANSVIATNPTIWYDTVNDVVPVYVDANTNTSYEGREAFYGNVIKHDMNNKGDYAFTTSEGDLYFVSLFSDNLKARLEVSTQITTGDFTADTVAGSTYLRNISSENMSKMVLQDTISGTGIPDNTKVTFVGSNYVTLNNPVGFTNSAVPCVIKGTRLVLDANRVIIPKTLTAGLVETDFYSSIARVPDGFPYAGKPLYYFDNITGVIEQYSNEGELLMKFTPAGGLELSAGIKIGGVLVPEDPSFTDTPVQTFSQNTYPTTATVNDSWFVTDNNVVYLGVTYLKDTLYTKATNSPDSWNRVGNYSIPFNTYRTLRYPPVIGTTPTLKVGDQWFNTDTVDHEYSAYALYILVNLATNEWEEITPTTLAQLEQAASDKLGGIQEGATNTPDTLIQATKPTTTVNGTTWLATSTTTVGTDTYISGQVYVYDSSTAKWTPYSYHTFIQTTRPDYPRIKDQWKCTNTHTVAPTTYYKDTTYIWDGLEWDILGDSTEAFMNDGGDINRNENFKVSAGGIMTCKGAIIDGTLSAVTGTFTGDLIIGSDSLGRKVEVGSKGLLVTDSGGIIVHNLPAQGETGYSYYGHTFVKEAYSDLLSSQGSQSTVTTNTLLTFSAHPHTINILYKVEAPFGFAGISSYSLKCTDDYMNLTRPLIPLTAIIGGDTGRSFSEYSSFVLNLTPSQASNTKYIYLTASNGDFTYLYWTLTLTQVLAYM